MIRKKKGFTLVELLATIIILGLLVTIAYVSVTSILDRGNDSYYESQENMLVLAGREYFADHRSELPKEIGDTSTVTLETLIKEKYIDPIKDKDENVCDEKNSGVTAQKITDRDFQYYGMLVCPNYTTKEDKAKPTISFNPNKKSSKDPITVTMKITDNKEVKSYRYVITKDGEEYQDSGYQTYDGDITINLTELGLYRITGYAIDSSGNTSTRRSGQYSVYKGIDCSQIQISSSIKAGSITNKDISISYKLPSNAYRVEISKKINGGEYELIDSYIGNTIPNVILNTEGTHQVKAVVYDRDGNSCIVATDEYTIDKTGPELNVVSKKKTSGTNLGNNTDISNLEDYPNDTWYNGYVVLRGSCSDSSGDCDVSYKVTGASSDTDDFVNGTTRNINAEGVSTIEYRATDEAGNVTSRTYTVKLDRTRPTITYNYSGGTYNRNSIEVCATVKDSVGIDSIKLEAYNSKKRTDNDSYTSVNATTKEVCTTLSGYETYTVYVKVYDYVGNKQSKSPENVNGFYYQNYTLTNPDPDPNFKLTCEKTCNSGNCSLTGYNGYVYYNDRVWTWNISGANSGINKSITEIRYSTNDVQDYAIYTYSTAPWGTKGDGTPLRASNNRGYAYFTNSSIKFSRSYANLSIVGKVCTNSGKCKTCTVTQ